jgi:antitoxin ParD1/3/4
MAKNTSISLSDQLSSFVELQVSQGRFGSDSEVVRAGLRLLEEHEARVEALRSALAEGERSGPPEAFDFDQFLKERRGRQPE